VTAASALTDEQLLAAIGDRESEALSVLYDRHHRLALAVAQRMLADRQAAEDVVQEVFLAVWRQASGFRAERGAVRTWLLAMVHHRAVDLLRRRSSGLPRVELNEELADQRLPPVWQQAIQELQGQAIAEALEALPAEQRQAIELAYFGGKSQSEIASLLGVPLGTVKGRTRLALERLRGLLGRLREEPA
jgi:RNA polymerase sigma-70 factor (ECF subfamily)